MHALPTGTVTFVLTDIEGSTKVWARSADAAANAVRSTYEIIGEIVADHGGLRPIEQGEGDSTVSVFTSASAAARAALEIQLALHGAFTRAELPFTVRVAVHTGDAELRDEGNYMGPAIIRCARLRALASGGDVLLSGTTAALVADDPPADVALVDLGEHQLRDLSRPERVWRLAHPALGPGLPLRSAVPLRHNLPATVTELVGRRGERQELADLVDRSSIVTLTGSGGVGKTRLALAVAGDLLERFPDGVWLVELAAVADPGRVPSAVAAVLGTPDVPGRSTTDVLADWLSDRSALLVLDNCEHVVDAAASLAVTVTERSPRSRLVASSREPLGVPGEVTWRTPSLGVPDPAAVTSASVLFEHDATMLFCRRAEAARPGFAVNDAESAIVADLCERLDGVPLAIELAAARVRSMSLRDLRQSIDDRFRNLTGGARTALPRQRTLAGSVAWSYDLLDDRSRRLFRRLSVFAGRFTADAVLDVCTDDHVGAADVLDVLSGLVDRSLVDHLGSGQYRLLETLRHFAQEQAVAAAEIAAWRDRHLCWCRSIAPALRVGPGLTDDRYHLGLGFLPDFQRAFEWSLRHDDVAVDLVPTMASLQDWSARHQNNCDLAALVRHALPDPGDPRRISALAGLGNVAFYAADLATVAAQMEALALATDPLDRARLLLATGEVSLFEGLAEGTESTTQAVDLAREVGSTDDEAAGLFALAMAFAVAGRLREARPLIHELDRLCAGVEGPFSGGLAVIHSLEMLGESVPRAGRILLEQVEVSGSHPSPRTALIAVALLAEDEGLAHAALGSDRWDGIGGAYLGLGGLARGVLSMLTKDWDDAADAIASSLGTFTMGSVSYWIRTLDADTALHQGDDARARRRVDEVLTALEDRVLPAVEATARLVEAELCLRDDAVRRAHELAHRVLRLGVDHDAALLVTYGLEAVAVTSALLGRSEPAARLAGAAAAQRDRVGATGRPAMLGRIEELLADPAVADAVEAGRGLTLRQAVAQATRARGARGRAALGWDALTPAELDVATLAAEGMTTKEIARKLFVSPATVKTHIHHIYEKLGVGTRAELARTVSTR